MDEGKSTNATYSRYESPGEEAASCAARLTPRAFAIGHSSAALSRFGNCRSAPPRGESAAVVQQEIRGSS